MTSQGKEEKEGGEHEKDNASFCESSLLFYR